MALKTENFLSVQSLEWVFGKNANLPAFVLQDHDDQLMVLYAGSHVGIIFNHTTNSQRILQVKTVATVSFQLRWKFVVQNRRASILQIKSVN